MADDEKRKGQKQLWNVRQQESVEAFTERVIAHLRARGWLPPKPPEGKDDGSTDT